MADVLYVVLTVAFFLIGAALVRFCDHVIGPDEHDLDGGLADLLDTEREAVAR